MTTPLPMLVGDGVENPANAVTLTHAAALFGWSYGFWDRSGLAAAWAEEEPAAAPVYLEPQALVGAGASIVAVENGAGARPVYGFRLPAAARTALVVGNERTGVSGALSRVAAAAVEIPMASRSVNCLNVAAAAAVALYYLARGGGGTLRTRPDPNRHRPELLLVGGADHVELGSTIRSAAAFGWRRAFVEDRAQVWFGADRGRQTEGRAAARRAKNAIKLVPTASARPFAFDEAWVVTTRPGEIPLGRANLAGGPRHLLALADEGAVDLAAEELGRLARRVRLTSLELAPGVEEVPYHFRLFASMALAECARQLGAPAAKIERGRRPPIYDRALRLAHDEAGEWWTLDELQRF